MLRRDNGQPGCLRLAPAFWEDCAEGVVQLAAWRANRRDSKVALGLHHAGEEEADRPLYQRIVAADSPGGAFEV
jgi:hypothetical protein